VRFQEPTIVELHVDAAAHRPTPADSCRARRADRGCWFPAVVLFQLAIWLSFTPLNARSLVHGPLKIGKTVSNKVGAVQAHVYELSLDTGWFANIVIRPPGFSTVVRITSIDGQSLVERKLPGGSGRSEPLYWITAHRGNFRLQVSSQEPGSPAPFVLERRESRRATERDESRLVGQQEFERGRLLNDEQHNYREARSAWERALKAFEQAGDRERDGATLLNMGIQGVIAPTQIV
jgi:hypothetical protein